MPFCRLVVAPLLVAVAAAMPRVTAPQGSSLLGAVSGVVKLTGPPGVGLVPPPRQTWVTYTS